MHKTLQRAGKLYRQGNIAGAERAFRKAAAAGPDREAALRALADLYLQSGRPRDAAATLTELLTVTPDNFPLHAGLAGLLETLGEQDKAADLYRAFIARHPGHASAHFNLGLLYRKDGHFEAALAAYEKAIENGINRVEEVYSNMGVVYSEQRRAGLAREMYERALVTRPDYIPALYNLAGLLEEIGQRDEAIRLYRRILSLEPRHWNSLCRLAHARQACPEDMDLVTALQDGVTAASSDPLARESLYFAQGKVLDDLGRYDEAFDAYRSANALGRRRCVPYERRAMEQAVDRLIGFFSGHAGPDSGSTASPIFICGMYRSGSTLVEQVLAAHPLMTAGGELEYLPRLVSRDLLPYPERLADLGAAELLVIAGEYMHRLRDRFPRADNVSDKRPDNFFHLGLIKMLFPAARIIETRRNPIDNCLSIYFQQLDDSVGYATDMEDIAHFHQQYCRLMQFWKGRCGDSIHTVNYEELVHSPEPVLRRLLQFLGLEWDERCLAFQHADSQVRTASLWQVREPLYTRSSGRWRNYSSHVQDVLGLLQ